MMVKVSRGIKLYETQWKYLDNCAKKLGVTRNRLIEMAIREFLIGNKFDAWNRVELQEGVESE